ncbi:GtrA family protein [Mycobacterium sp. 236(2023)]|uniref:GtrA family protein n=1 Tax=Mycobacterium sp. 236(2023) TaxID=3038163 RepID=UPI002415539C|nr:GtrA family protein [Mycobacterium sp. 236(2023)]MDG4663285.1 GtrA family protein [Mycobacterium sp. 236(2023)]
MLVLAPERFHRWCTGIVSRLPFGLADVVPPMFLGFCLINSFTFAVDLVLLVTLRGGLGVPYPIAVTVAYACAFGLSYALNRYFNFRSHAPVGPQLAIYIVVVVVNYLAFILALSTLLTNLGIDYRISRLMAGGCEAAYMYCALRWVVFRKG